MIVSSSSDTCATEEPKMPGSISRPMRRTPSCARLKRGRGSRPSRVQGRELRHELHDAGDEHADREHQARFREVRRDQRPRRRS